MVSISAGFADVDLSTSSRRLAQSRFCLLRPLLVARLHLDPPTNRDRLEKQM